MAVRENLKHQLVWVTDFPDIKSWILWWIQWKNHSRWEGFVGKNNIKQPTHYENWEKIGYENCFCLFFSCGKTLNSIAILPSLNTGGWYLPARQVGGFPVETNRSLPGMMIPIITVLFNQDLKPPTRWELYTVACRHRNCYHHQRLGFVLYRKPIQYITR